MPWAYVASLSSRYNELDGQIWLDIYAEVFEEEAALDRLEAFAALNGPAFYGRHANAARITLRREPRPIPERIGEGENVLVPFRGGETLRWRLVG